MKNVPHWQWLMLLYFLVVAVPVYAIHNFLKERTLANRTLPNLLVYIIAVVGTAFLMHAIAMWLYFTFFFTVKN